MSKDQSVLWFERREGYGWFRMPERERVMRGSEWKTVEEGLEGWTVSAKLAGGVIREVTPDTAAGEVRAYVTTVDGVPSIRMALLRLTPADNAFSDSFRRWVKESGILSGLHKK